MPDNHARQLRGTRRATAAHRFLDFTHREYSPRAPVVGKWCSRVLLEHSFEVATDPRYRRWLARLTNALHARLGPDATVWGVKNIRGKLAWEYYFYDYTRSKPALRPSRVLDIVRRHLPSLQAPDCDHLPWFMFSIDVPGRGGPRASSALHLYMYDVGERPTACSYVLHRSRARLENHYAFYRPSEERDALLAKVRDSAMVDFMAVPIERVLLPELLPCKVVCVANKTDCDGIYFSGLGLDQFLFFLERFDYPPAIVRFIELERAAFDHLEYDVGFDYRSVGRSLAIKKSGYYGTF